MFWFLAFGDFIRMDNKVETHINFI